MTRLSGDAGFSLTELLISLIMLSIGVVGFATAVSLTATELRIGRRDTDVALLAADRIEILKAMSHDSVAPGSSTQGDYQLDWVVEGSNPKKVTLVATFPREKGGVQSDTFVCYIAR